MPDSDTFPNEFACIGHRPGENHTIFFEEWFIQRGYFRAPGYTYEVVGGNTVHVTRRSDGMRVGIYRFDPTDAGLQEYEFYYVGSYYVGSYYVGSYEPLVAMVRKGVWPD